MKSLISIVLSAAGLMSLGLTNYEASSYGSRILICGPERLYVLHWTATKQESKDRAGQEDFVFDLTRKRFYPFASCEPFECSPDPGRLAGCIIR